MFSRCNKALSFTFLSGKKDKNVKLRALLHLENKKNDCFNVDSYCDHCKTAFEAMG